MHHFVDQTLHVFWTQLEPAFGKLLVAALFISIIRLCDEPLQNWIQRGLTKAGTNQRDKDIVAWISRIAFWAVQVFGVAGIFGYDIFDKLFASIVGASALLAFALKDTVNDFFCGMYLRFNKRLDVGTEITLMTQNITGEISEFGFLSSILVQNDKQYMIPNRLFWGAPIGKKVGQPAK